MAKTVLDFEKPIVALEQKIAEMMREMDEGKEKDGE